MLGNHLSNEDFFVQLSTLFDSRRENGHGSVFLTQKRLTTIPPAKPQGPTDVLADLRPSDPQPILVRATNGKSKASRADKTKLSTVVEPDAQEAFFSRYAEVCKAGMGALKKRDRSARKKAKAKKRKAGAEGEKRG
ncbi:hypothetical protein FGG08_003460 [Glutinoglossum americanum]|uniref:Signal recognition particle subunit SRP14 n=1 Tax=Glutinoglossum americanum TaxID=1670608 RepID=A0A9P8KY21_9PEZI|nr:hypothetical protein FGG08_003460 [Glutinoglossum americanum]